MNTAERAPSARAWLVLVAAVVVGVAVITGLILMSRPYRLQVLMPTATGVIVGDKVLMGGQSVGTVRAVRVHHNRDALLTLDLDRGVGPLHQGTDVHIVWEAVLLERAVELRPGPAGAPVLPSGSRLVSRHERVELDDLLATLDPKTLRTVDGMVQQLRATLTGREHTVSEVLRTAGPAVNALGEVLRGVAADGPALRELITNLHQVTATLAQRRRDVAGVVTDLRPVASEMAAQQHQLSRTLAELPPTLAQATSTLDRVPDAAHETVSLLDDLRPATDALPRAAALARPVLADLRPVVHQLRPTLTGLHAVLDRTPTLLDTAHDVLPPATHTVANLRTPIAFLRPYIPEATGWLTNWAGVFGNETATGGNYARLLVTTGTSAYTDNPGVVPPGMKFEPAPAPGSIAGQPWTDAQGDGQR